jgi:predicted dehydrogenase
MKGRLTILIVGVGSIGERHLRCFQATDCCELALCETVTERRETVAAKYAVPAFASVEEALDAQHFDAAVIAVPAPFHIPLATQLTERGLHLLIEKPLSVSLDGVADLQRLIGEKQTQVAVGYTFRAFPALIEMKAAIDSGRFGVPVQFIFVGGQHFPFYRPAYREIYYTDRAMGGGAIQDGLTHEFNVAEWLVGPITRLVADADHCVLAGVEVEDTVHVITRHGPVLGSFSLNQHQPPNECRITVVCDKGAVRFEADGHRWFSGTELGGEWQMEAGHELDRDRAYVRQAEQFLDQIADGSDGSNGSVQLCSLADSIQTLKVNLAALRSVETRQWIDIE